MSDAALVARLRRSAAIPGSRLASAAGASFGDGVQRLFRGEGVLWTCVPVRGRLAHGRIGLRLALGALRSPFRDCTTDLRAHRLHRARRRRPKGRSRERGGARLLGRVGVDGQLGTHGRSVTRGYDRAQIQFSQLDTFGIGANRRNARRACRPIAPFTPRTPKQRCPRRRPRKGSPFGRRVRCALPFRSRPGRHLRKRTRGEPECPLSF